MTYLMIGHDQVADRVVDPSGWRKLEQTLTTRFSLGSGSFSVNKMVDIAVGDAVNPVAVLGLLKSRRLDGEGPVLMVSGHRLVASSGSEVAGFTQGSITIVSAFGRELQAIIELAIAELAKQPDLS